jgi:aerobic C4-dicarboxylate transport protein
MAKKPIYKSLYFQVIIAIIAGVLVGHFYPSTTQIVDGVKENIQG